MEIKYGDIKYFQLLRLQDQLKSRSFQSLDLVNYDKLRNEVDMKVDSINYEHDFKTKENKKTIARKQRLFDFWCSCIVYHHPHEYSYFKVCSVCNKRDKGRQTL